MIRQPSRCATSALLISLLALPSFLSGCGGGGGTVTITIQITSVDPTTSADLNGGDTVRIMGTNFNAFIAIEVNFGAQPASNLTRISDTELTVRTPGAPGGVAGIVDIRIVGIDADGERSQHIFGNSYTYVGPPQDPNPQTISRTMFTATGAEEFFIAGTSLGAAGATQVVEFEGVGRVNAVVSGDATSLQGNAPISGALGAGLANVRVIVDPDGVAAVVPTQVNFPAFLSATVPGITNMEGAGEASLPRRFAEGFAVLCTAGADSIWGNANDEIWIVFGPVGGPVQPIAVRLAGLPIGFLHRRNSIPAILDQDTICVYSLGPDQLPNTGDDRVVLVTQARSGAPAATFIGHPNMNTAPLGAIAANRVAFMFAGADGTLGTIDDTLQILEFNGATLNRVITSPRSDTADTTAGKGNLSIPWSTDGDNVYVLTSGNDATAGNANDRIHRLRISTGLATLFAGAPSLVARPIAVSPTVSASVTAGGDGIAGTADDALLAFSDTGGAIAVQGTPIGALHTISPVPFVPFGNGGVAVPTLGPNIGPGTGDEQVIVFTDPVAGVFQTLTNRRGPPVLTLLRTADNSIVIHNPGGIDNVGATGDEVASSLNGTSLLLRNFTTVPLWDQLTAARADDSRVFVVGRGPDALPATSNEVLIVHQTRSLSQITDSVTLPVTVAQPLTNTLPFVPIGNGWGLVQSPGNLVFGNAFDVLVVIHY